MVANLNIVIDPSKNGAKNITKKFIILTMCKELNSVSLLLI